MNVQRMGAPEPRSSQATDIFGFGPGSGWNDKKDRSVCDWNIGFASRKRWNSPKDIDVRNPAAPSV